MVGEGSMGLRMEQGAFKAWLQAYGRAWMGRDARAAELFAVDGTYQVTPFAEPMRGRTAILEYWSHVAETQRGFNLDTRCWQSPQRWELRDGGRRL